MVYFKKNIILGVVLINGTPITNVQTRGTSRLYLSTTLRVRQSPYPDLKPSGYSTLKPGFARLRGFAYPYLKPLLRLRDGKLRHCGGLFSRHKARGVQDCDPLTAARLRDGDRLSGGLVSPTTNNQQTMSTEWVNI